MYRATTPTFNFTFDVDPDATFTEILVTFKQGNNILINKNKSDLTFKEDGVTASFTLTQEETNKFDPRKFVSIQVRALTTDNEAVAFKIIKTTVFDVLNDMVLT